MTPTDLMRTLAEAARVAQRAPSVFNSQPWRWVVGTHHLDLLRDRSRRLPVTDADGRQLTISCGAALHHARIALAAAGRRIAVARFPDPAQPDLLARLDVRGRQEPDQHTVRLRGAISDRRTDRRGFSATPVSGTTLARLDAAAAAEDCSLHLVRPDQVPVLAAAAGRAATVESTDPAYRAQLTAWTTRPPGTGDGVPAGTAAPRGPRPVPMRDFAPDEPPVLDIGVGEDDGARYVILYGTADDPPAWLRGGEALSAVLLTAVLEGAGSSPMSDLLEVEETRRMVRGLLPGGHPYLVLRIGVPRLPDAAPRAPRRAVRTVVQYE